MHKETHKTEPEQQQASQPQEKDSLLAQYELLTQVGNDQCVAAYAAVNEPLREAAIALDKMLPPGEHRDLALTRLLSVREAAYTAVMDDEAKVECHAATPGASIERKALKHVVDRVDDLEMRLAEANDNMRSLLGKHRLDYRHEDSGIMDACSTAVNNLKAEVDEMRRDLKGWTDRTPFDVAAQLATIKRDLYHEEGLMARQISTLCTSTSGSVNATLAGVISRMEELEGKLQAVADSRPTTVMVAQELERKLGDGGNTAYHIKELQKQHRSLSKDHDALAEVVHGMRGRLGVAETQLHGTPGVGSVGWFAGLAAVGLIGGWDHTSENLAKEAYMVGCLLAEACGYPTPPPRGCTNDPGTEGPHNVHSGGLLAGVQAAQTGNAADQQAAATPQDGAEAKALREAAALFDQVRNRSDGATPLYKAEINVYDTLVAYTEPDGLVNRREALFMIRTRVSPWATFPGGAVNISSACSYCSLRAAEMAAEHWCRLLGIGVVEVSRGEKGLAVPKPPYVTATNAKCPPNAGMRSVFSETKEETDYAFDATIEPELVAGVGYNYNIYLKSCSKQKFTGGPVVISGAAYHASEKEAIAAARVWCIVLGVPPYATRVTATKDNTEEATTE